MVSIHNFTDMAKKAAITILSSDDKIVIRHRVGFHSSTAGMVFLLFGSIFFLMLPLLRSLNTISTIIAITAGLMMAVFSLLSLVRQLTDGITIFNQQITWRYQLKKSSLPANNELRITMKSETRKIRRTGSIGSDWIVVTCFLHTGDQSFPMLQYQMHNKDADQAIQLGKEIIRLIQGQLQHTI